MWEKAAKDAVRLCGRLGRLHGVPGAHDMVDEDVAIDWGNGIYHRYASLFENESVRQGINDVVAVDNLAKAEKQLA